MGYTCDAGNQNEDFTKKEKPSIYATSKKSWPSMDFVRGMSF